LPALDVSLISIGPFSYRVRSPAGDYTASMVEGGLVVML